MYNCIRRMVPKPKVERPTLANRVVVNYQRLKGPHVKPSEIRYKAKQGPTPGKSEIRYEMDIEDRSPVTLRIVRCDCKLSIFRFNSIHDALQNEKDQSPTHVG
jgi:hypothetical protein